MPSDIGKYKEVSVCKGIAIILMVLGHTSFSSVGNSIIYMFHMPLFIFMSGYCFKDKYVDTPRRFIINKLKRLYLPFVIWSIAFILLHNVFYQLNIYNGIYGYNGNTSHLYSFWESIRHSAHVIAQMSESEELLGGFWFIKSLFCGTILTYGLLKVFKKTGICCFISLALSFIFIYFNLSIPFFNIGKPEIYSSFFFMCGKYYKQKELDIDRRPIVILLCAVLVVAGSRCWWSSLNDISAITLIPYSISALCGTLFCLGISRHIINHCKLINASLTYAGNNTLYILALHFLSFKIVSLVIIKIYGLGIEHLAEFPNIEAYSSKGWWIAYLAAGVSVPLLIHYIKIKIYGTIVKRYK